MLNNRLAAAAMMAMVAGAAPAIDNMVDRSVRVARRESTKGLGRTIHPAYKGSAKNDEANFRRGLKKTMGARQLRKLERASRMQNRPQIQHAPPDDTEGGATD